MKVLGLVGSPRKRGNTNMLVDTFLTGASSGAEVKKCFLVDLTINQCMGCAGKCVFRKGVKCKTHRDDMDELLSEVVSSDIVLFASPLYCATYTSLIARFFERALPLWHIVYEKKTGNRKKKAVNRCPVRGKKAVIGMVQESKKPASARIAFEAFEHNIKEIYKMDILEKIQVTDVTKQGDLRRKPKELKRIFELGKRAVTGGIA